MENTGIQFLFLATGGALGTVSRYYLSQKLGSLFIHPLMSPINLINLSGCFAAGLAYPFLPQHPLMFKKILLIGFLGAFTSFSSFVIEALEIQLNTKFLFALLQITFSTLLNFLSCLGGAYLAKYLTGTTL